MSLFKQKPRLPDYGPGDAVWLLGSYYNDASRAIILDVTDGVYIVQQSQTSPTPVTFKDADKRLRPRTVD